jgi:hypothetical protein
MAKCIASTTYNMKADIYQPTISQDSTGAVVKTWTFQQTINCSVKGILSTGLGKNSTEIVGRSELRIAWMRLSLDMGLKRFGIKGGLSKGRHDSRKKGGFEHGNLAVRRRERRIIADGGSYLFNQAPLPTEEGDGPESVVV